MNIPALTGASFLHFVFILRFCTLAQAISILHFTFALRCHCDASKCVPTAFFLREHAPKRQKPASKLVKDGYIQKQLKICKYVLTHPPECDKIGAIFCGQMLIKII